MLLVESGRADGDVRRPSLFLSMASRCLASPFSATRLRRAVTLTSILILPCWFVVEDDGGPAVCRRRCLADPIDLLLPAVLPFL